MWHDLLNHGLKAAPSPPPRLAAFALLFLAAASQRPTGSVLAAAASTSSSSLLLLSRPCVEMTEVSKVLHVRNVGADISENDLIQLARPFGAVTKMVMLRVKNQALVQMPDLNSAINLMHFFSTVQPNIKGRNVYIQFSSHQELTTGDQNTQNLQSLDKELQPNRILLATVHSPLYPITVDVLHQVFSPFGFVEKIVTFQKSAGIQALLQFASQHNAMQAKNTLQGRNIYDGCCTLDIQFSNLSELQVHFNNEHTRDYTNPSLPAEQSRNQNLQQDNNTMSLRLGNGNIYGVQPGGPQSAFQQLIGINQNTGLNSYQPALESAVGAATTLAGSLPAGVTGTNERCTLLVSNLDPENWDADKLFNIFSIYGNILRIKFLHNKPDHALVQMEDGLQAELALHFLKGITVFGKRVEVNFSKHVQIHPSSETHEYSSSKLNRFNNDAAKKYRHCCSTTKMVHVSSLPVDVSEEEIMTHLSPHGTVLGGKIFEANGKKQALMLFENANQATEAVVCKHASALKGSTIRLAFSKLTRF